MSEDKSKNSIKVKVVLWVLILLGIYFSFPRIGSQLHLSSILPKESQMYPTMLLIWKVSLEFQSFVEAVKPIDSVARNTLLVLRNKRTALDENGSQVLH